MRDLDLTTLRLFVAVCELHSMNRVSDDANMVPSAISKRLAALEDTVGVKLLRRRRRGMEPTAPGLALLEHARAILGRVDQIRQDMDAYASGIRGQIKLLASSSALAESLADDIAGFLSVPAHQGIQISLEETNSDKVMQGLRAGVAALGVCWDAADFRELEHVPYRTDRLALIVPASHPLAARPDIAFADTLDHDHVNLPATTAVVSFLRRQAVQLGKPFSHRVTVSTIDSALRLVLAGLGVSIVPAEVLATCTAPTGIVAIPLTDDWARRRFAICYRSRTGLSPAEALLVDYLAERAIPEGAEGHP